ncbi:CapA family protein, partial [Sinorhizobium medicae]|uniref:CapA family protein n=1 Tax=Sinorhizobium medicae TaxID=110321 RepID=UPI000FD76B5A
MNDRFTLALTGQSLIKHDIRDIRTPAFQDVQSLLRQADLSFTNFEGTILGTHGGWPLKGSFFGCSDPVVLDALGAIGFRALSLSNNHAFDLGPSGVLSTLEEVEKRGFLHAGLGRNAQEVSRASIATINQRRIALVAMDGGPGPDFMYAADADENRPERPGVNRLRLSQLLEVDDLAFEQIRAVRDKIGYTAIDLANDSQPDDPPRLDPQAEVAIARSVFKRSDRYGRGVRIDEVDMARNLAAIASAARDEALVIAYLHHHHWASDWYQLPEWVSGVAKRCIDAGASMFVSHGAPVLQPVEIYRGRPIFYSLGNFIFHVRSEKSTWTAAEVWESVVGVCS